MTTENPINLIKLKEMIKNGISRIPKDPNADEAIIVIGDTGVGKSTILAFLSGAELFVRYDGLKPVLDCPNNPTIKIGHEKYSQTSIPTKVVIQHLAFYDCPGFKDNKGQEYEISNSFFVQRLLDIYPKVKIVLIIDQSHISETRADKLPKLTKNLLKSFKTFDDIKQGVIMIINRAERDLHISDYHKEIQRMCNLANDRTTLFSREQKDFLQYLIKQDRIFLFKQPKKQDKNRKFIPLDSDSNLLKGIKNSNFVKSKHILNILSESAKLAIRDFIDEITARSNIKIQAICSEIVGLYSMKMSRMGKDVRGLLAVKEDIINLAEEVKSSHQEQIVKILQRELPDNKVQDFSEDFASVLFFKGIYDKTATYFSNLINKIYSELSHLLVKMDTRIMKAQKQQQEALQRQRQQQKRKQLFQQRQREKNEMILQLKKMQETRSQINNMVSMSGGMMNSMGDIMSCLTSLENEFAQLRQDASRLQGINQEMNNDLSRIETKYLSKISN